MKIKTSKTTLRKLIPLLVTPDASTKQFLDELPTPEKYAILAIAMIFQGYQDYEEAYDEATRKVPRKI